MASRSSPITPKSKSRRGGETDASKTSQSVKAATPRSNEQYKSPRSPFTTPERRSSAGKSSELQQMLDEVAKLKEDLASAEEAKALALEQLAETQKLSEELSVKLNEASETSQKERSRVEEIEHACFTAAEDWQAELEAMKKKYEEEVDDLQITKEILENLKQELLSSVDAKNEAVKLAGEAMIAAQASTKRAEEISTELSMVKNSLTVSDSVASTVHELIAQLSSAKESLAEAQISNEKIAQEGAAMLAAKDDKIREIFEIIQEAEAENETLKQKLASVKGVESEAIDTRSLMENLKIELALAEELKLKASLAVADVQSELEKAKSEIEQAGVAELKALTSLASAKAELEKAREDLKCELEEKMKLTASLSALQIQLDTYETELANLKDIEQSTLVKVSDVTKELSKCQKELADLIPVEKEARETIQNLSVSLEKLQVEARKAKQELHLANVEAERERELALAAEAEAQVTWGEVEAARKVIERTKSMNEAALLEAQETKLDAEKAKAEGVAAKAEAEKAREETDKARAKAKTIKEEVLKAQEALQMFQKEAQKAKATVHIEREEADCARENAQAALLRVKELEAELKSVHLEVEEAALASKDAECKLQDALREMETRSKMSAQDRNREASEICATAEKEDIVHVSQEEYDSMQMNLQEAKAFVVATMAEIDETKANTEELTRRIETMNKEIEINKLRALQEHQQLEQAQKSRANLEAEVQRLSSNMKQQQNSVNFSTKLQLDSEFNCNAAPAFCEDKSVELDSHNQVHNPSVLALQNDDGYKAQPPSSLSKKKKAIFLKLRAYLAAKMKNHR